EQSRDEVRILTTHGAKGLQSPVVILPDTVGVPDIKDRLFWHEEDGVELPLWLPSVKSGSRLSQQQRTAYEHAAYEEYRRLLYVAMTRAADQLYVCGAAGK